MKQKKIKKIKTKYRNHISFSQIDTYLRCPRQYRFRYIDRIERVPSFNTDLVLGSYVHNFIAEVLERKLKTKDPSKTEVKELIDHMKYKLEVEYKRNISNDIEIVGSVHKNNIFNFFEGISNRWVKDILPEFKPVSVEQELRYDILGNEFLMYIDAIQELPNKKKRIVDWKVTNKKKSDRDVESSIQLSIYSYATKINDVAFVSLIKPKNKPTIFNEIITTNGMRGVVDYKWLEEIISGVMSGIKKDCFPVCSPSNFLCNERYCDYWDDCRGKDQHKVEWI